MHGAVPFIRKGEGKQCERWWGEIPPGDWLSRKEEHEAAENQLQLSRQISVVVYTIESVYAVEKFLRAVITSNGGAIGCLEKRRRKRSRKWWGKWPYSIRSKPKRLLTVKARYSPSSRLCEPTKAESGNTARTVRSSACITFLFATLTKILGNRSAQICSARWP